jgi:hypothetical protein
VIRDRYADGGQRLDHVGRYRKKLLLHAELVVDDRKDWATPGVFEKTHSCSVPFQPR